MIPRLLIALTLLLSTTALARVFNVAQLLEALKPNIMSAKRVNLGTPLAIHSRESKYLLSVKSTNDEVVSLEWFMASPPGSRIVFKTSALIPVFNDVGDAGSYALSYVTGFAAGVCLGVDLSKKPLIGEWIEARIVEASSRASAVFQKQFGALKVTVGGSSSGFLAIILERSDKPGAGWVNTCRL